MSPCGLRSTAVGNLLVAQPGELWRKVIRPGTSRRSRVWREIATDVLLLQVDQIGPACHTGLRSCFDTESLNSKRGDFA